MIREEPIEGDLVSDLVPLKNGSLTITGEALEELLERAAYKGYLLAEEKRQSYLTTPDGLLDKTISGYKPLPYNEVLSQSSTLLDIQGTGMEKWLGDTPFQLPPELLEEISSRLFSVYPRPLLLQERINGK